MAAEKDASEAIRSVVATLPNIKKLKREQEQSLLSFVGGHDVVALLHTGFGKRHASRPNVSDITLPQLARLFVTMVSNFSHYFQLLPN
jgi:hypothetical protein